MRTAARFTSPGVDSGGGGYDQQRAVDIVVIIVGTALLSAALTGAVLYRLWTTRILRELEAQARAVSEEITTEAIERLNQQALETGEVLVPQFRQAIRDGIQDAILTPPTDRLGQTAREAANAGVNVVEASLRRIFGVPPQRP